MRKLIAVAAAAVVLAGCGPKPGFSVRQERVEIERTFNEEGVIKSEKVVGQNVIEGKFNWPTNGELALSRQETFQPDNKNREVLTAASWAVKASSDSTEAMVFGVNQTDRTAETVQVGLKTAGAVGTAGLSEAPDVISAVAQAVVGQESNADTSATLDSAKGILNDASSDSPDSADGSGEPDASDSAGTPAPADAAPVPSGDPAPAVSADDAVTTPTAEAPVPVIDTTPETTF